MAPRLLITAFGPFGPHAENPASLIAKRLPYPSQLLEVAYRTTGTALRRLEAETFDLLLMLGVHGGPDAFRIEMFARNLIGPSPDVRGSSPSGPIVRSGPPVLGSTLFDGQAPDGPFRLSFDAGDYLCNYSYYQALRRFTDRRVGFLHVPTLSILDLETQVEAVRQLAESLRTRT